MRALRIALAALLLACGSARATTFATDMTDLWWTTSESGWGVNVIHQDNALFLTFFVYGANGSPVWYSASDVPYITSPPTATTYSGDLFQTSGPFLGGAYDQRNVVYRKVGTVTWVVGSSTVASLSYTVDGVTVTKTLTRYTFRVNNMSGVYRGVFSGVKSNCVPPGTNGPLDTHLVSMIVSHNNAAFTMATQDTTGVMCTYTAGYTQHGKVGTLNGAVSCSNGRVGQWQATEVEANTNGFFGRLTDTYPGCSWTGKIAAARS